MKGLVPVGALVMVLGAGGLTAEAGQRDSHGRDRNGRESQGQVRQRDGGQDRGGARAEGQARGGGRDSRQAAPSVAPRTYERADRGNDRRDAYRYDGRNDRRGVYRPAPRYSNPGYAYRGYDYRAPRIVRPGHYYGPGGNFSVYFGLGNGYLFGSPWSGRVYGRIGTPVYGARIYYGDVRLQVQPRDAAVYVDGYYAGIVDDFDGTFQRLTLEVGPHQIELDGPGLEPQFFDVYVDPTRTTNIRADLFR